MTAPRAWVRPDGTLYVRDPHGRYGSDVTWLSTDAPAPERAVPLVAVPEVDGEHHDAKVSAVLDVLRKAASGAIGSTGLTTATNAAPWLRELADRCVVATERPGQLPRTAAVTREDTASQDEDIADPCLEDAHGTCHAPGHSWHEGQRRRSSSPAVAPDAQRAALTQDALLLTLPDEPPVGTVVELIGGNSSGDRYERMSSGPDDDPDAHWKDVRYSDRWATWVRVWWGLVEDDARDVVGVRVVPPASLAVGDVVTDARAVSAPVGTTLGAKSAAVAAVHTTGGWSVTGMNHEQDHEHAVRINEWVVLALPEATS